MNVGHKSAIKQELSSIYYCIQGPFNQTVNEIKLKTNSRDIDKHNYIAQYLSAD